MEAERLRDRIEHRDAEHVGGQEVARELHARVPEPEVRGQRLRQRRFADARDVLDQQMPAREQAGEREPQRLGLADEDAAQFGDHRGQALRGGNVGLAQCANGHRVAFNEIDMAHSNLRARASHHPGPGATLH